MMDHFDSEDDNISRASSNRWSVMAFELPGSDILKTGYLKKLKVMIHVASNHMIHNNNVKIVKFI